MSRRRRSCWRRARANSGAVLFRSFLCKTRTAWPRRPWCNTRRVRAAAKRPVGYGRDGWSSHRSLEVESAASASVGARVRKCSSGERLVQQKRPDAAIARIGPFRMYYCRQRPTLPHSFPCSTIGGIRLNFRVRNGNGCDPDPMTTGILTPGLLPGSWCLGFGLLRRRSQATLSARVRSSQTIFSKN
jgi:hypothetical protein